MSCRRTKGRCSTLLTGWSISFALFGCHPEERSPTRPSVDAPAPLSESVEIDSSVELELVPAWPLPVPWSWRFSPDGRHLAASEDGVVGPSRPNGFVGPSAPKGCRIWAVDGRYAGEIAVKADAADPCRDWLPLIELGKDPLPGRAGLDIELDQGRVVIREGAEARFELECDPAGACVRPYVAAALDPEARRVVLARTNPIEIVVWRLDAQQSPISLTIPDAAAWTDVGLVWGARGIIAVLGRELRSAPLDPKYERRIVSARGTPLRELLLFTWPEPDQPGAELRWWHEPFHYRIAYSVYVDPLQRWLWVHTGREGKLAQQWSEALNPFGLNEELFLPSIPGWGRTLAQQPLPTSSQTVAEWRVGPGTAWIDHVHTRGPGEEDDYELHDLTSRTITLSPKPSVNDWAFEDEQFHSYEWQILGVDQGELVVDEAICVPSGKRPDCRQRARAPQGCRASEGPVIGLEQTGVRASWLRCESGPHANTSGLWRWDDGPLLKIDVSGASPPALVWTRSSVAVWTEKAGLRVFDEQLRERSSEPRARALHRAALDAELGLALVSLDEGLVVLWLDESRRGAVLDATPPRWAALHPRGTHLALAWDDQIAVFEIATGRELVRWSPPSPLRGIAWRQDGDVLFTGHERALPELAWDAWKGTRASHADLGPALLERLASADLDPSWRWARTREGTLLRILDGAELLELRNRLVIAANGRYQIGPDVAPPNGWAYIHTWSLRPADDVLAPLVPLDVVGDFRRDVLSDFVAGVPFEALALAEADWRALVERADEAPAGTTK